MEAIAAVERHLAQTPDDPEAWNLKRVLYSELREAEYEAATGPDQVAAVMVSICMILIGIAALARAEERVIADAAATT